MTFKHISTFACLVYALVWHGMAHAVYVPYDLDRSDREQVVRVLGLSASSKLLSNPYPLGGYDGFEGGLSLEWIDVRDLNRAGCAPSSSGCPNSGTVNRDFHLSRFAFSKGIFKGVDLSLSFIPPSGDIDLIGYGGAVRYAFFEGKFIPITLSLWLQADLLNYGDRFSAQTLSAHLITGFFVESFSIYMGLGQVESTGLFIGGTGADSTIDPSDPMLVSGTNVTSLTLRQVRSFFGATLHFDPIFFAVQIDRFPESVISARVGIRL